MTLFSPSPASTLGPFLLAVAVAIAGGAAAQDSRRAGEAGSAADAKKKEPPLSDDAKARLALALASPDTPEADWLELHRAVLARGGDAEPLFAALAAAEQDTAAPEERRLAALAGKAILFPREGRLVEALANASLLLERRRADRWVLLRAHLLDALGRVEEAIGAYGELGDTRGDPDLAAHVGLRLALLRAEPRALPKDPQTASAPATRPAPGAAPGPAAPPGDAASALFLFASEGGRDPEIQNRAAIVLALIGRPQEAIQLYQVSGEGRDRFRQEVRLAEWALVANRPTEAQEHAWEARAAATLARDRRYALTVLVEAHRADGSLDRLLGRFAEEPKLDDESRHVWIDLLQETERVDEAMGLFARGGEAGFTTEMRRELLEMCRQSGRDEQLVETYRKMIAEQPGEVEWREGLSRHYLERGRREEAEKVWIGLVGDDAPWLRALHAAQAARDLGLEDLARSFVEHCMGDPTGRMEARLFLFDLQMRRGRAEQALAHLEAFDREADPKAPQRVHLSEAFERAGNKRRAADVLEGVRATRGGDEAEEDLEMRLAWLLSEVGDEKAALARWRNLWERVASLPRRRQVEDRLMATASRLGALADLAVELEEKLAAGKASDRESGLLVRLYTKVGDPVSAAEVLEEHLRSKPATQEVAVLEEKARVYLAGKDYYHFERSVRKLVELDPERRSDHLRQLAMSNLERGRPAEARAVLGKLAELESPSDAAEFEAGVLALANLNEEAARVYRRGLAAHPERIDVYLLLGNVMRSLRKTDGAIGMFQCLAETAQADDLFTVAIDGLLNMRAKEPVLRWARRATLERIARRHDKMYLYQLYADLSEELNDVKGTLRALETALAIAGEQRAAILRQMMEASLGKAENSYTIVNGVLQQRRRGGEDAKRLAYGRRLIGLGDLVPPQVYLELGESFLRAGEVANAARTFAMARDVPDLAAFRRRVADSFEREQYAENALAIHERAMASQSLDLGLLAKTAELHEKLGRDARAADLYRRGIEVLLAQHPLAGALAKAEKAPTEDEEWIPKNTGDFDRYFPTVRDGFLATATEAEARALFDAQRARLEEDLAALDASPLPGGKARALETSPRARHRAAFLRRVAILLGWLDEAEALDLALLRRFEATPELLEALARERLARGQSEAAVRFVERSGAAPDAKEKALARLGRAAAAGGGTLRLGEVVARLVPLLLEGDREKTSLLLRGARLGETSKEDLPFLQILVSAAAYARDEAALASLTSYALRATVAHAQSWEDRERVVSLAELARGVLSSEGFEVLVQAFAASVAEKDKSLQEYQYSLMRIQQMLGKPVLAPEAVRKRLEACLPSKSYMVSTLLSFVPPSSRLELLRPLWPRVPAAARASLAASMLARGPGGKLPEDYAGFLAEAFEAGVDGVDEARSIAYPLQTVVVSTAVPVARATAVAEAAAKKWPDDGAFHCLLAVARMRAGDSEGAFAALREGVAKAPTDPQQYHYQGALHVAVSALGAKDPRRVIGELANAKEEPDESRGFVANARRNLMWSVDDPDERRAILEEVLARNPRDAQALMEVAGQAAARGDWARQIELLERALELEPKNPWYRNQLSWAWRSLGNPIRALAARQEGGLEKPAEAGKSEARKLPAASIEAVRKAVDDGKLDEARALYRRLWRQYHVESPYGFGAVVSYGWGSRALLWPEKPPAEPPKPAERWRGGLEGLRLDDEPKKEDPKDPSSPEKPKRRTAYEALAEIPFGRDELSRQVRALGDAEIGQSRAILRGLALAEIHADGEKAAVAAWRAAVRTGKAGAVERALLLAYFDDHAGDLGAEDRALLSELALGIHPLDGDTLRALARLHAKLGDAKRATALYRWCATLAKERRWFYYGEDDANVLTTASLVDEAQRVFQGAEAAAAVEAILATAEPRADDDLASDAHETLVLDTWTKLLGPARALERGRSLVERALDPKSGRRQSCYPAARLLLEAGEFDKALAALDLAITPRVPKEDPESEEMVAYYARPQRAYLDWNRVRALLPKEIASKGDLADWYSRFADRAAAWAKEKRVERESCRMAEAAALVRLCDRGALDRAAAIAARLAAEEPKTLSEALMRIDLARKLGREDEARAAEDLLLAEHRILAVRVPEVLARVRAAAGDGAAFARGEEAAGWTLEPGLLDLLVDLATKLGRADRAAHWTRLRAEAAAAAAELDKQQP